MVKVIDAHKVIPIEVKLTDKQFSMIMGHIMLLLIMITTDKVVQWGFLILAVIWIGPGFIKDVLDWIIKLLEKKNGNKKSI